MLKFYSCETGGLVEKDEWMPHYWINVEAPDDQNKAFMRESLCVPESFLDYVQDIDERPRFEHEDGWLLTIVRIPLRDKNDPLSFATVPLGIMTKDDIIITVCMDQTEMIPDFINHCNKRHIDIDNQPDFVLRIIYSSTFWFLRYLKIINDTETDFTRQLEKSVRNEMLLNMMRLQKSLVYFNTSLQGNSMLVERLNKVYADDCDADLLEDVEIELRQACNTVAIYTEILSNSMDTFASVISNNVNDIMKKMTSISIILMIPTLVASFYGMNVAVWHGTSAGAFWVIVLASMSVSALIWYWLRRVRWL